MNSLTATPGGWPWPRFRHFLLAGKHDGSGALGQGGLHGLVKAGAGFAPLMATIPMAGRKWATQEAKVAQSELELKDWGTVEAVPMSEGHQVQQFTVNPGAKLPLRVNDYQCEHWVVVKGVGRVQIGRRTSLVDEGGSLFIPARAAHSVENIGDDVLRIIAVHYGAEWPSAGQRYMSARKDLKGANTNRAAD